MSDAAAARAGRSITAGLSDLLLSPLTALELLTLVPVRRARLLDDASFGVSQAWFPAVGLALGAALAGAGALLYDALGAGVTGWLLVAMLVLVTGGLHVDGLGDTADGLWGGRTREERLRIMRDGSVGALGAATIFLVLGLKATSLGTLDDLRWQTLVLAPCLGRWASVVSIAAFPYARQEGLGRAFHDVSWPAPAVVATTTTLLATLVLLGPAGLLLMVLAGATALVCGSLVSRALGGLTGDVYGATVEICEALTLLGCIVLARGGVIG